MNSENIFIGTVMICVGFKGIIGIDNCESKPVNNEYEKNVILIKVGEDRYVDIRNYGLFFNINRFLDNHFYQTDITMGISPNLGGEYFVEQSSLRPYYLENKNINVLALRKELNKKNRQAV